MVNLFLLGLAFGAGPCLASCGPLVLAYTIGTKKAVRESLLFYVLFSAARITVYIVLGLIFFVAGKLAAEQFLGSFSPYLYKAAGFFIILIGFLMALGKNLHLVRLENKGVFAFGLIAGLLPCAPLVLVYTYIGLISKNWHQAVTYSFSFGLGTLLSPLLLLVIIGGAMPGLLKKIKVIYSRIFTFICGMVIIILGINLAINGAN